MAVGMAVDDPGDDVGEVGLRIDSVEFAGSISEAMIAQCSPPPSEPAKRAFLRLRAMGRMARRRVGVDLDAAIVKESGEPLPSRERVADRLGELGLLADQAEFVAQPRFERRDDRPALLPAGRSSARRR